MLSGNGYLRLLPVYPLIAQQILDDYQVSSGICLDIGTGPGHMGLELAKITDLEIFFVDIQQKALDKARENAARCGLDNRLHFTEADVCDLPFENGFADLVVSRGSLWFWADQVKGLQEIYRVLKPGGVGFAGGGVGRYTPASMRKRLKGMGRKAFKNDNKARFLDGAGMRNLLEKTGLKDCRIVSDVEGKDGSWIEMHKGV
jgi:ubiquinone/menaquinone biosynthesis C-methylase UbiE